MSRTATIFTSTAGSPQYHTVGDVRLQPQQAASGWHSPVPYLFGGLAAMLGLIAFALLILACSYWKLSAFPESSDDVESGNSAGEKSGGKAGKAEADGREMSNVVVIMAGQLKPTFLATPSASTSRTSSFGDSVNGDRGSSSGDSEVSLSEAVEGFHGGEDPVRRGSMAGDEDHLHHHHHQLHSDLGRGDLAV